MRATAGCAGSDRGSVAPLILLCFLLAALVVMGTAAAGSAFLAQRDLQSLCDSAALAAADGLDPDLAYGGSADLTVGVPLSSHSVAAAIGRFRASGGSATAGVEIAASTDGRAAALTCRRTVHVPFQAVFGRPGGLPRMAISVARAPGR